MLERVKLANDQEAATDSKLHATQPKDCINNLVNGCVSYLAIKKAFTTLDVGIWSVWFRWHDPIASAHLFFDLPYILLITRRLLANVNLQLAGSQFVWVCFNPLEVYICPSKKKVHNIDIITMIISKNCNECLVIISTNN